MSFLFKKKKQLWLLGLIKLLIFAPRASEFQLNENAYAANFDKNEAINKVHKKNQQEEVKIQWKFWKDQCFRRFNQRS